MDLERRERAVVLGGSMAGLLAARVLADRFDEVLVVDRDELVDAPGARRGTPQARHLHALLAQGQVLLEELLPGLTRELEGRGAPTGDMLADTRVCFGGHEFARGSSGLTMIQVRRPTLEQAVRRRVESMPSVRLLVGRDVVGLVGDRGGHRVVGARVISRVDGSAEEELPGDLVVEATGRGSRLPVWLDSLGVPPPPVETMQVGVGYTSQEYAAPPDLIDGVLASLSGPTPRRPRGGGLARMEDGCCLISLMGLLGDHPPTDPVGMLSFAAELALPEVHRVLQEGAPIGDAVAHRHPTSVRHRYDRVRTLPSGLVALGDAVCALNPIYGQGMTVAALEAVALGRHLDRGRLNARRYQRTVGRLSGAAWALSTGGDLTFPEVEGRRTAASRILGQYVAKVQAGAARDPALGRAFLRVTSLVDPPAALLRPAVLARVASPGHGSPVDDRASAHDGHERVG